MFSGIDHDFKGFKTQTGSIWCFMEFKINSLKTSLRVVTKYSTSYLSLVLFTTVSGSNDTTRIFIRSLCILYVFATANRIVWRVLWWIGWAWTRLGSNRNFDCQAIRQLIVYLCSNIFSFDVKKLDMLHPDGSHTLRHFIAVLKNNADKEHEKKYEFLNFQAQKTTLAFYWLVI